MSRDNFTKQTVDILGKRVGFLCSNPSCRKPTVGANEIKDKSTAIGIAAHITAASPGGPRFDKTLSPEQRKNIDNGIWLCSNCASLIDKDKKKYSVKLLNEWKNNAEIESRRALEEGPQIKVDSPYLEGDLIFKSGMRMHNGFSSKNPFHIENGVRVFNIDNKPIIHWKYVWDFNLSIYNNSAVPAFNVKVESIGEEPFSNLARLPKIKNIPPLEKIDLRATYEINIEDNGIDADKILKSKIKENLDKLKLQLSYYNSHRKLSHTFIEFKNDEIQNYKE